MMFTSKLSRHVVPLLFICFLLAACGGSQTPEPYIFKFEETETPTAQPILSEGVPPPTEAPPAPEPITETGSSLDEIIADLDG